MNRTKGIDYRMPKGMFDALLKKRHDNEKNMDPYAYVLKIINETFGIKGEVTHISFFE